MRLFERVLNWNAALRVQSPSNHIETNNRPTEIRLSRASLYMNHSNVLVECIQIFHSNIIGSAEPNWIQKFVNHVKMCIVIRKFKCIETSRFVAAKYISWQFSHIIQNHNKQTQRTRRRILSHCLLADPPSVSRIELFFVRSV